MISLYHPCIAVRFGFFGLLLVVGCNCGTTHKSGTTTLGDAVATGGSSSLTNTWNGTAPSCKRLAATCGPLGLDDCCKSIRVPGGAFARTYDGVDYLDRNYPATVSDFYLDKYEITVGRFRVFVNTGMGTQSSPPGNGAGAHPKITGSGWNSTWNIHLSASTAALSTALKCYESYPNFRNHLQKIGYQTWTDTAEGNEAKPLNCLDWYTAFAFCVWDGGRLATEAEWNYAASGGNEQRHYPWSTPSTSTTIDDSYAVYCGGTCSVRNVGSKSPKGDGKWGHSDLAGNTWEWTLDWRGSPYPMPCKDCADVTSASYRVFRGGSFDDIASTLRSAARHVYSPNYRGVIGTRCARNP